MTKKEMIKLNKQRAQERMQATDEYKEAQMLIEECNEAGERGDRKASSKAYYRAEQMLREARRALRAE